MDTPSQKSTLPLDDVMLAMDVVDTLRHRQDLVTREIDGANREVQLIEKLRDIYRHQGIEVPDHILKQGVDALAESRFVYLPPKRSFGTLVARLYVSRNVWGRWIFGAGVAALLIVGSYLFAYLPYQASQREAARIELAEALPARMDQLYDRIFQETKVQVAVTQAEELRTRGKHAAAAGDRAGAQTNIAGLESLLAQVQQDYTLKVVNREGVGSGFWTFPEVNTAATNYYIVVEAIDTASDVPVPVRVENEETGQTEQVTLWGLRVPESVYRSVESDKLDDGVIQRNIVGVKQYGFLDTDYVVPTLGGAVTRW